MYISSYPARPRRITVNYHHHHNKPGEQRCGLICYAQVKASYDSVFPGPPLKCGRVQLSVISYPQISYPQRGLGDSEGPTGICTVTFTIPLPGILLGLHNLFLKYRTAGHLVFLKHVPVTGCIATVISFQREGFLKFSA